MPKFKRSESLSVGHDLVLTRTGTRIKYKSMTDPVSPWTAPTSCRITAGVPLLYSNGQECPYLCAVVALTLHQGFGDDLVLTTAFPKRELAAGDESCHSDTLLDLSLAPSARLIATDLATLAAEKVT